MDMENYEGIMGLYGNIEGNNLNFEPRTFMEYQTMARRKSQLSDDDFLLQDEDFPSFRFQGRSFHPTPL